MKVQSIKIKNFKSISEENIQLNGNNVYLLGQNGVGKTSFIDSVFKIISGKELPKKVTKEGENNGFVEIDLGQIIAKAIFNSKNEKISLSIESKDGASYKSPRTMLDELSGVVDFDLNNFFNLTPKKQVDFIKNICGIDFSDLDETYKELYDERTFVNRAVKELEAQKEVHQFNIKFSEEKPIEEIQQKLQKANEKNFKINEIKNRQQERVNKILSIEKQIESLKEDLEKEKDLQLQAGDWLSNNNIIDVSALQQEFNEAIDHNKKFEENKKAEEVNKKLHDAVTKQEQLNKGIEDIQNTKKRIISESKIPVPGLSFDEDQLYYNGLPFEKSQINTAQQIIVGLQINLALLKEIKIARFDGSLLDNKNISEVEKWAKENDLQLFVEFVDRNTENLKIEIKE